MKPTGRPFIFICDDCGQERDTRVPHKCGSFAAWLRNQTSRDDTIGELAQNMVLDDCWPKTNDLDVLREHLTSVHDAIPGAVTALEAAYNDWMGIAVLANGHSHNHSH